MKNYFFNIYLNINARINFVFIIKYIYKSKKYAREFFYIY